MRGHRPEDADGAKGVVEKFFASNCLATADRYAIETSTPTLLATQQMAAAQYIMLMS